MSTFTRAKALGSVCALALTGSVGVHVAAGAGSKIDAGDLKALAAGLALERTAIKTYTDIAAGKIGSPPVLAVLGGFLTDHTAHRDALIAAIAASGQQPTEELAPLEVPQLATESDILNFVYGLERSLASTHLTALPVVHLRIVTYAADHGIHPRSRNHARRALGRKRLRKG